MLNLSKGLSVPRKVWCGKKKAKARDKTKRSSGSQPRSLTEVVRISGKEWNHVSPQPRVRLKCVRLFASAALCRHTCQGFGIHTDVTNVETPARRVQRRS